MTPWLVGRLDAEPSYKKPALVVDRRDAERVLRLFQRAGLLDPTRKIVDEGASVRIPVRSGAGLAQLAQDAGAMILDDAESPARDMRRSPREDVQALLRGHHSPELVDAVPDKWEQHGDVLVLRVPDAWRGEAHALGAAFAQVFGLKSVLDDAAGVAGELREMRATPIFGSDTRAEHRENGVRYRFDAAKIMFSSGNLHERTRTGALDVTDETIVDMFAGIGYFTLPLAVHAKPARIYAVEKNPVSFRFLVENVALNGVGASVVPSLGDNRAFSPEGIADRVLMGYFPHTEAFLPKARALLKPSGGRIHFHNTAHAERWRDELVGQIHEVMPGAAIEEARIVKTHSPGIVHALVVARV